MSKVATNISLDYDLKKEAVELFSSFGLDLSTAITLFLSQSVREQRIPFTISKEVPNKETLEAVKELERMKSHPEEYKDYDNFEELLKDIGLK